MQKAKPSILYEARANTDTAGNLQLEDAENLVVISTHEISRSADLYQLRRPPERHSFFLFFPSNFGVRRFFSFLCWVVPNTKTWCDEFALETLCKKLEK